MTAWLELLELPAFCELVAPLVLLVPPPLALLVLALLVLPPLALLVDPLDEALLAHVGQLQLAPCFEEVVE